MPAGIVNVCKVDDEGQVWFLLSRAWIFLKDNNPSFAARILFYKKGKGYFIEVSGKATIEDFSFEKNDALNPRPILAKLTMINVTYNEAKANKPQTTLKALLNSCSEFFSINSGIPDLEKSFLKRIQMLWPRK